MYAASEVAKASIPGEHSMESKQRNPRDGSKAGEDGKGRAAHVSAPFC